MACRQYEEALRELAAEQGRAGAGNAEAEREMRLRAHLETCVECGEAFQVEQRLYADMDAALREEVNIVVPGSLAPRIRAAVETDAERARAMFWRAPAFAALAALSIALTVFIGLRGRHDGSPPPQTGVHAPSPAAQAIPSARQAAPQEMVTTKRHAEAVRVPQPRELPPRRPSTEVLVPAGQEEAVARLLVGLQRGDIKGEMLLAQRADFASALPEIAPLEIRPVVVRPVKVPEADSE